MTCFEDFVCVLQMILLTKIKSLRCWYWGSTVDRMSTRDKANIRNPKVNRGCPPLTANCISADCVQISLGPPIQYIPLRVYHTGGLNAMENSKQSWECFLLKILWFLPLATISAERYCHCSMHPPVCLSIWPSVCPSVCLEQRYHSDFKDFSNQPEIWWNDAVPCAYRYYHPPPPPPPPPHTHTHTHSLVEVERGYTGFTLSVCPSICQPVRMWTKWYLLCIFDNTCWIHSTILTHLIKQLQLVR